MIERVAILGTGLLGTSVGLALRAAGFKGSIVGWNRSRGQAEIALSMGAIDSIGHDAIETAKASQVVLLAVPIFATLDLMEQLAAVLGPDHLVTDVGSTKGQITEAAKRLFNHRSVPHFSPVIPWRARSAAARTWPMRISSAAPYGCLPTIRRGSALRSQPLSQAAGASGLSAWVHEPIDLGPQRHDELVAWVSHLPQFIATALSALLENQVGDAPELKDVGGRALREMTRLGASP